MPNGRRISDGLLRAGDREWIFVWIVSRGNVMLCSDYRDLCVCVCGKNKKINQDVIVDVRGREGIFFLKNQCLLNWFLWKKVTE